MYRIWLISVILTVCYGNNQLYRCPSNLPRDAYLKSYGEKCYQFVNVEMYWTRARDTCSSRGGMLVQIRTAQIQQFVMESLRSLSWNRNGVWIGAHDLDAEGHWKWVEGHPLTYTNWAPDQPGGCTLFYCGEDCANLRLDDHGRWHDYDCSLPPYTYSFICEFYMGPATTTTSTTTTTTTTTPTTTTITPTSTTTRTTTTTPTTTTTTPTSTTTMKPTTTTISTTTTPLTSTSSTPSTTKSTPPNTSTDSGDPAILQAVRQNPDDKNLDGGEIAGIIVSLLLVAFIGGFLCAVIVVRRRRKELPNQEYTVTFDNVTYVIRALNPFQRDQNPSRHLVLNSTIGEPPPQYEELDNQRNISSLRHQSERQENHYDTADITPKKYKPTVDMETCTKSVDFEKTLPPPYEASNEKKLQLYDVPDEYCIPHEEQPYHEISLPTRHFTSSNPYSLPDEGATGYETPVTLRREQHNDGYLDSEQSHPTEGASYNNNLYDVSDA